MQEPSRHALMRSALGEKACVVGLVLVAILMFSVGMYLALTSGDPHWMNRIGAAIVCVEAFTVTVELHRRRRLEAIRARYRTLSMDAEIKNAERKVVYIGVALAVCGEFLHGFGDLLISGVVLWAGALVC